ncbi:MAG: hypothetical protein ABII01_07660, partial [Candidatus Woesearchaeota archaeon]
MEFKTAYNSAMDRSYYAPPTPANLRDEPRIEDPLIPINELGETVVERDPRTGANILQNVTAAIRAGAGNIQLVMSTPPDQAIGGRSKAYGKEVREAIRELTQANEVNITGVELPTAISNLSGYNQQSGMISDETRFQALNEVKDAIKFVADVAQGGGIDIFSVEYPRTIFDSEWNRSIGYDKKGRPIYEFQSYPEEPERAVKHLVDDRTGRVIQEIRMNQEINYPVWNRYNDENDGMSHLWKQNDGKPYKDEHGNIVRPGDYIDFYGNKLERKTRIPEFDPDEKLFKVEKKTWNDFMDEAGEINAEIAKEKGVSVDELSPTERVTPQEAFMRASTESQERIAKGYEFYYGRHIDVLIEQRRRMEEALDFYKELDENLPENEKWKIMTKDPNFGRQFDVLPPVFKPIPELIEDELFDIKRQIQQSTDTMVGQRQTAEDLALQRRHVTTAEKYAKERSVQSYAEAGLFAMDETNFNRNVKKPLYVGPEIGWPQGYGAHPDEFIQLIRDARREMADQLVKERGYN